ncbi:MAG: ATP-binding protein [Verrucomicrobiota bacterium]|jgi:two-component system, NtrC family, sensor kinase
MLTPVRRFSLTFQAKVLIPVVLTMVLLMAWTTWVVNHRISKQLETDAAQQLRIAEMVLEYFQQVHTNNMALRYRNVANEPRVKALAPLEDSKTLQDFFEKLIRDLEVQSMASQMVLFVSETERIARFSLDPSLDGPAIEQKAFPSIRQAFQTGHETVTTFLVQNQLYTLVCVPVEVSDHIAAVLGFVSESGSAVQRAFNQFAGSEIAFLANDKVVLSTIRSPAQLADLDRQLPALLQANGSIAPVQLLLNGLHFYARVGQFQTGSDTEKIGVVLLASYEHAWQELRSTHRLLIWVRVIGIILAVAIVFVLVRQVMRPLRDLRDGAEAVGRGDFSHRVPVTTRDECGELAMAFNKMTENLKSSREELERTVETLRTTQAQLVQSEKLSAIGEFVAGVTHELNNPLTAVIGFADLLKQTNKDQKNRLYLDNIVLSAQRCHKIVQSLLSFARQHQPERRLVVLNELVENTLGFVQYELHTGNIQVLRELDPQLPAVLADPHQIQQVLLNIINNARQAIESSQPEGWIRVRTESRAGKVRVIIQDSGPGIPPEALPKIFNPFFTTKEIGKGTGLGLSLSYGIIQEHNGSICAISNPGEGATFTIELPIGDAQARPAETRATAVEPATPVRDGEGRRILAIDDEPAILELIRQTLLVNGYQVDTAIDGESGLIQLAEKHYDLTLCDWKMPGLNGQQVFERLKAYNPRAAKRLVFMTGDVINEKTQSFFQTHGKICLSKPFSIEDFRSVIRKVIVEE